MKIDVLISKYLDGELTPDEDIFLRKKLSEDKSAKLNFDTDINIHYAIKKESKSLKAPEILLKTTEDSILMKILANAPIIDEKPIYKLKYYKFSSLVAALIVFTIFNISDLNIFKNLQNSIISLDENLNNQKIAVSKKEVNPNKMKQIINNSNEIPSISDFAFIDKNDLNINNFEIKSFDFNPEISKMIQIQNDNSLTDLYVNSIISKNTIEDIGEFAQKVKTYNSMNEQIITFDNRDFRKINSNSNTSNNFEFIIGNSDVMLSSTLQSDFYNSGIEGKNIKNISSFAQSIAYFYNENNRFGLELGSTEFTFNDKILINVPVGKVEGADVEVNNGNDDNDYIRIQVSKEKNQKYYWGSIFYENQLYKFDDFSLIGRVGIGTSNIGIVSYGRLFMNYNLISGIYLTIGADSKLFQHKHYEQSDLIKDWRMSGSIIYGLQFKF